MSVLSAPTPISVFAVLGEFLSRSGIARPSGNFTLHFLRNCQNVVPSSYNILYPSHKSTGVQFLHVITKHILGFFFFFIVVFNSSHPSAREACVLVGLMAGDTGAFCRLLV